METFFQLSNLAYDFGMVKYIHTKDIVKLAEHLMLSRDLAKWEKYQADRSPGRTSGANSLSQSVFQKALQLILDPSTSMIGRGDDDDGLIKEEDKNVETT